MTDKEELTQLILQMTEQEAEAFLTALRTATTPPHPHQTYS